MAMDRWDPFRDMMQIRDVMERAFMGGVVRPASALLPAGRGNMPIDVTERGNTYTLRATLPGVRPDQVQVTIAENTVTIAGHTTLEQEDEEQNYLMRERRAGSFRRSVTLPAQLDANAATASFEHGVLTLRLPKAATAEPRRIPISSSNQRQGTTGMQQQNTRQQNSYGNSTEQQGGPQPGQGNAEFARASMQNAMGQQRGGSSGARQNGYDTAMGSGGRAGGNASRHGVGINIDAGGNTNGTVTEASEESFPASDAPAWTPDGV